MALHRVDGPGGPARPQQPTRPRTPRKVESPQVAPKDTVELSPEARQVSALVEAAKRLPDVRTDKVERVREALQQGTYNVDPRAVARAILEFEDDISK